MFEDEPGKFVQTRLCRPLRATAWTVNFILSLMESHRGGI